MKIHKRKERKIIKERKKIIKDITCFYALTSRRLARGERKIVGEGLGEGGFRGAVGKVVK